MKSQVNIYETNKATEPDPQKPQTIEIHLTPFMITLSILLLLGIGVIGLLYWDRQEVSASANLEIPQAPEAAVTRQRKFYLSLTAYYPPSASTACAEGYHFASMWEIVDPTNLQYAFDHPNAHNWHADSGQGPPSDLQGWVRTGNFNNNSNTPGKANCSGWTTNPGYGTRAWLTKSWVDDPINLNDIWEVDTDSCGSANWVWCVED